MTADNVVNLCFVLVMLAAIIFRIAYRMFREAHQLVADARSLTDRAEQTARETLEAQRNLQEGAALITIGACDEEIELFRESGFRVTTTSSNSAPRP
jgi:hypothetical protein